MTQVRPRLDSKLEATGAEHLVLGRLLIEGVQSFIASVGQRDYDIIATNPQANTSSRIQVKSRWATDANRSFPISKLETDFVVFALLNRGIRYRKPKPGDEPRRAPEFFVLPIAVVKEHHRVGRMSVLRLRDVPDYHSFLERWDLIQKFLGIQPGVKF